MTVYRTNDTDLKKVADAIRAKGGTSANLTYPNGFVSAIQNIPSGGGASIGTKSVTNSSATATSIEFSGLSGQPIAFFVRTSTQISSSGSTTYYYIIDMVYDGTSTEGNCFRIGSTRRIQNVASGSSFTYSSGTL